MQLLKQNSEHQAGPMGEAGWLAGQLREESPGVQKVMSWHTGMNLQIGCH